MRQNLCRNEKAVIRGHIHHVLLSSAYLSDNSSHFSTWQQRSKNWCLFELWGEHCFEPLIKPAGKWHDNLWGDTDPVSAGENANMGRKRRKNERLRENERGGAGEGRWTTTRDKNDTFFLSINLGHNEIWIWWLVAKKIAQAQAEPHLARHSSCANKSSTLLNCGGFSWRAVMRRKETGFEMMGFPGWANWLQR